MALTRSPSGAHSTARDLVMFTTAAFPAATGPRTIFEVSAGGAALALTFRHRSRRWTIDGLDDAVLETRSAAPLRLATVVA